MVALSLACSILAKAVIYRLQLVNQGTQCIYSEGIYSCMNTLVNCAHLGINSYVNPQPHLLKQGSLTVNISLENFDPRLMLSTSTNLNR